MYDASVIFRGWTLPPQAASSFWERVQSFLDSATGLQDVRLEGNQQRGPVTVSAHVLAADSSAKAKSDLYAAAQWAITEAGGSLRHAADPVPEEGVLSFQFSAVTAHRREQ